MNNKRQDEYDRFLAQLRDLKIDDLLLLYIEAKTGSQNDVDKIPSSLLEAIDELGDTLN